MSTPPPDHDTAAARRDADHDTAAARRDADHDAVPALTEADAAGPSHPARQRQPAVPFWKRPGFLLPLAAFVVYNLNFRVGGCGDDLGNRLIPLSILRHATVTLDPYRHLLLDPSGQLLYHAVPTPDGLVSIYPIGTPLLALPVYLVPSMLWRAFPLLAVEKLAASLMAAAAVWLVYACLHRLGSPPRQAALFAGIFAFSTPVFSIASQALCQHPAGTLAVAATLYCAVRSAQNPLRWVPLGGLCAGAAIAVRPQLAPAVVPLTAWMAWRGTSRDSTGPMPLALAGAAAVLVPIAAYNWIKTGGLAGGYALAQQTLPDVGFRPNILPGLAGLLLSPGRGLLFYAPPVLFAIYGAVRAVRERDGLLISAAGGALATLLLFSAFKNWWGGFTFGPRYLTEVMPLIAVLLPSVQRLARQTAAWAVLFLSLCAYAAFVQFVGTFAYPCSWDGTPESVDLQPSRNWNLSDTPITRCVSEGFSVGGQELWSFNDQIDRR